MEGIQRLDHIIQWILDNPNAVEEERERRAQEDREEEERRREEERVRQEQVARQQEQTTQSNAAQEFLSSLAVSY